MAIVGNIMVRVGADINRLQRSMTRAQRIMRNSGANLKAIAFKTSAAIAVAAGTVGTIGTKMAMEYEANLQQVNRIFGENANVMEQWANDTAINFNMARNDAVKYASVYGNLISNISKDTKENAELTQELLKKSAVVAGATGRTMEDVMERIRSGLLGNTEAIILSVA
jgi:predicted small secreted protein